MPCWVTPAVAAEIWGVSLREVLERVRAGHLPSKTDLGFLVVDVAPWSPQPEARALVRAEPAKSEAPPAAAACGPAADQREFNAPPMSWQTRRRTVAMTRRGPAARKRLAA
jgi:hypothetical protein